MPDATVSTEQQALAELARSHRWRLVVLFGSTARAGELLCESAADIGLQVLKRRGVGLAGSYREVFTSLQQQGALPQPLAERLHVHVLDYEDYH
jgi:uncharacterized protein YutE (UPF0331/DUF86 family)